MIVQLIELMGLVILVSIIQMNYKIPSPITLMGVVLLLSNFGITLFKIGDNQFDMLVMCSLPLLLTSDALKLKWKDLQKYRFSVFWVAVVSILFFIGLGVVFKNLIISNYNVSYAEIIILLCILAATDPITVSAIFSNFKVPHKLKFLTEGESLFNDATALIVFNLALVALNTPEKITISFITMKIVSVVFGSIIVGLFSGVLTKITLKFTADSLIKGTIIIFYSYVSYVIAEHYHFSGILAVIVSSLIANQIINNDIEQDNDDIKNANKTHNIGLLKNAVITKEHHETIFKTIDFASMFVSALLFISIASVVDIDKMMLYKYEILGLFVATTILRGISMLKFAILSHQVSFMHGIQKHWWAVLTFAGSKGALSILMVHMIPNTFRYKEMFEHVVIGNILLSIFVYSIILTVIFKKNKEKFKEECMNEKI